MPINKSTPNNIALLESFIEMLLAERNASNNTISSYTKDIKDLILFLHSKNYTLKNVTNAQLIEYLKIFHQNNFARSTISRKISSIKQFFLFLVSNNVRKDNPTISFILPKKSDTIPKALTKDQVDILLESASNDKTNEGIRNSTMLEILYSTGMRISELVTLKTNCLHHKIIQYTKNSTHDNNPNNTENKNNISAITAEESLNTKIIIVKGKGGKERVVVLNDNAINKILEYLPIREQMLKKNKKKTHWLFPSITKKGNITHITRQRFGQILKCLAKKNNIDHQIISPHKIRHSFATHMLQNGANIRIIQELMGHSSINSTQIYTKIFREDMQKAMQKHPIMYLENSKKNKNT